jgi:hypothetical protein
MDTTSKRSAEQATTNLGKNKRAMQETLVTITLVGE